MDVYIRHENFPRIRGIPGFLFQIYRFWDQCKSAIKIFRGGGGWGLFFIVVLPIAQSDKETVRGVCICINERECDPSKLHSFSYRSRRYWNSLSKLTKEARDLNSFKNLLDKDPNRFISYYDYDNWISRQNYHKYQKLKNVWDEASKG